VKRWLALTSLAVLGSCKLGGPSANPDEYLASDAGDDATLKDAHSQDDDSPVASDDDAPVAPGDSGGPGADDADDASTSDDGPGVPCTVAASDAGCDPVHNTGCMAPLRCDVSLSLTGTPTGTCVLYTGSDAGGACSTFIGETCPPGSTCVNSACRTLCYCDSDCPANQCCSDKAGAQGFTLCTPCP
jgi:hypothetical protein